MAHIYNFNIEKFFIEHIKNKPKLILIAGTNGVNKTVFAFHLALEALKHNRKVIINSLEMNVIDIQHKLFATKKNISFEEIDKTFQLNNKYSVNEKMKMNLNYYDKGEIAFLSNENDVNVVLNDIENFIGKNPDTCLIILDSLELYSTQDKNNFLEKLKLISVEYNLSVLILSQLKQSYDGKNDLMPINNLKFEFIDLYVFLSKTNNKINITIHKDEQ